ncbi:TAT-variant-translocated molybdopterin oxidoreductase [Schlesneria paludicola]|uniref:TAT-variant-translocated molybdopterin oxidoreductase n=1 Tax=Schlesneria paludicola TaxID=360056 RepID=UPI00029A6FE2|nr:TAT-variant-translocated molybdopterin oxidoreductase [Schlesneria paludicola]
MTALVNADEKTYWRSLGELAATPEFTEFLHREFPVAASEFPQSMSRRRWLQLMGASLAMAGISGCWQKETLAPFAARPENRIPGVPQRFATSLEMSGYARPVIVTAYDGRPIKIEGHVDHPASMGGTDSFTQAALLHLYDPDRSRDPQQYEGSEWFTRTWDDFVEYSKGVMTSARATGGKGVRVIAEHSSSPSRLRLAQQFAKLLPEAKWYEHESVSRVNERQGGKLAFGQNVRPIYDLSKADVILALDSDLFDFHPNAVSLIRKWSERRVPEAGPMNRVYAVESQFSTLGVAADHRLPIRSCDIAHFLATLQESITAQASAEKAPVIDHSHEEATTKFIRVLASDLIAHRGKSVIVAGPSQSPEVIAAIYRLNAQLGNLGETVTFLAEPESTAVDTIDPLATLAEEMERGDVETLIVLGGNPAYESASFATAMAKVKHRVRLGAYVDETSQASNWHLPRAHQMEVWGDGYSYDGILTIRQPLIDPIFSSRSDEQLLALLNTDEQPSTEAITRATLESMLATAGLEDNWRTLVHDGFLSDKGLTKVTPTVVATAGTVAVPQASAGLEVVFCPSNSTYDGRFANNGWLQETPAPLTKMTWQNAAIIAPATSKELKINTGDVVRVTVRGKNLDLPAYVLPGQAKNSIGLALGYGRTAAGHVGGDTAKNIAPVGANVSTLRARSTTTIDRDVKLVTTGKHVTLAITQDHHAIDKVGLSEIAGRIGELVREGTEKQFADHPDFAQHVVHHPPLESLWEERSAEGHAWGMSIDLSRCIGCNACMVACQSENNVPIVGPEQVSKGREMHWIRVDRYFAGDIDSPQVVTQPVTCQHCENAPCEQVCPVAATVHSPEGLNDMAYNRCVGTRYCANNCPYKVRRFNFLDFTSHLSKANEELSRLIINPEVTVRSRGVMEKCTFCVQRIQTVKIQAKNEQRPIVDGAIQTACQQACPAGAIQFGDLMDKQSQVSKAHANPRAYAMLAELNVKPRTKYLARIRNPHPELSDGHSTDHGDAHGHTS